MIINIKETHQSVDIYDNAEDLFETIFHEAPFGIALTDSVTGQICEANQAFARITGRTPEELKTIDWMSLTHTDDVQKDLDNMNMLLNGKTNGFQLEKRYILPKGNIVWINMKIVPLNLRNKFNPCHLCMIEDVTDRYTKEGELRKLSRAVQQSPVSILITDIDGKIVYGNPKVSELSGYRYEELLGKNVRMMKSGETPRENYDKLWETILSGNEWKGEFLNKKKNGEFFWESASISPIFNSKNTITNFLAIKEDITERKKVFVELESAKTRAESSDRLKTAFINNISHETRTPLNGILGFSSLLLQPDITDEERTLFHSMIKGSSARLLNTINNYMDIALISSGNIKTKIQTFNLHDGLRNLWNHFNPMCEGKNLKLRLNLPDKSERNYICSDSELIRKIFSHLLDNSVKFTNKGEITYGYCDKNGIPEFYIQDSGIGISKSAQSLIFESFIQEESLNTKGYDGSGLGLSIAKGLVDLLGGSISVESEKGEGSLFTFMLPCELLENRDVLRCMATTEVNNTHKPVILIADDDKYNQIYIQSILKRSGLPVYFADNGQEAVDLCREHPEISFVLMDMKMPVMDGLEATALIKLLRKDITVVAITAFAMSGDEQRILEAGCDDYISKPISPAKLLKKLSAYGILS